MGYVYTFFYAAWMGISDVSSTNLGRPWCVQSHDVATCAPISVTHLSASTPPRKNFENFPLFKWMFAYFPMKIQTTSKKPLDPKGLYVFGE